MSTNFEKNLDQSMMSRDEPVEPDPWITPQSESYFPSPLELDRLLREPHPLLSAAEKLREISPAGLPNVELLPAHAASCQLHSQVNSVELLLEHELKLHNFFAEQCKGQVDKALALLYWLATEPDQQLA